MHGQDALLREHIVEDGEHRFLQLASIPGAAEEHRALPEMDDHERSGPGAVGRRIGMELGGVEHRPVGREAGEVGGGGTQKHVVDEQCLPRIRGHEPNGEPVVRIGAREHVAHEQLLSAQVLQHGGFESIEVPRVEGLIHPAPRNVGRRGGLPHDELVVGAASRVRGGHCAERAAFGDHPFAAPHGLLVELRGPKVPVDGPLRGEPRRLEGGGAAALGGSRGVGGHVCGRRPCSCASTAAITAMFTMSLTSEPRCSTCTGCAMPTRIGPIASAPPTRWSSL